MHWRQTLRALVKWALTLVAAGTLAVLMWTWLGRLTWDAQGVRCSVGMYRGVVFVTWASPGAVEKELQRFAALPALLQDERGAMMVNEFRRALQANAAAAAKEEAYTFDPERARGLSRSWLWLGGTCRTQQSGIAAFAFPLWPLLIAALPPAWILWRPDLHAWREVRRACCAKCGYDRRGLAAGARCPECGTVPTPPRA
jgi:hypothetical protein